MSVAVVSVTVTKSIPLTAKVADRTICFVALMLKCAKGILLYTGMNFVKIDVCKLVFYK